MNLRSDSLGKSNDLDVSNASRIHFGFGFIVNRDLTSIVTKQPNLQQVANLLCVQVDSTSSPQQNGKRVIAYILLATDEGLASLLGRRYASKLGREFICPLKPNPL